MRHSKQRELVRKILKAAGTHPTAEQVYEEARKVMPEIGIATVYRNLKTLVELGEAGVVRTDDQADHFDGRTEKHAHLLCDSCGRIMDLELRRGGELERLRDDVQKAFGVEDAEVEVRTAVFHGRCPDCLRNGRTSGETFVTH